MSRSVRIFPSSYAAILREQAGKKYRPVNGTEGELFFDAWCCQCQRDKSMREGAPLEDCDDNERCDIIADTFAYDVGDPNYPAAWQYDANGQPVCTAFVEVGQPVPFKDTATLDLFAAPAASPANGGGNG